MSLDFCIPGFFRFAKMNPSKLSNPPVVFAVAFLYGKFMSKFAIREAPSFFRHPGMEVVDFKGSNSTKSWR